MLVRGKGADDTDAAEILLHDAGQHRKPLLQVEPCGAQPELCHRRPPADEGHETQRQKAKNDIGRNQHVGADADQHRKQEDAHERRREIHAHAFEIEQADRDQVTRMNRVVKAEGEPLDLLVTGQPKFVAHVVAYAFAVVVLDHREEAAQHAGAEQQQGRRQQRVLRDLPGSAAGQCNLRVVHRLAEKTRDHQLECGCDEGCADGEARLPGVTKGHDGNADQSVKALAPACRIHKRKRSQWLRRAY